MRINKKIKGFTLIEMLVTLSLSTVVVAFAYMTYNYIFSTYVQFEKINASVAEFTSCQRQLLKLSNNAEKIEVKERSILFHLKNNELMYAEINPNYILFYSESRTIDTAQCLVSSFNFTLGTTKINNGYIDGFSIYVEFNKVPYKLYYEKCYDSEKMILLDSLNKFTQNGKY